MVVILRSCYELKEHRSKAGLKELDTDMDKMNSEMDTQETDLGKLEAGCKTLRFESGQNLSEEKSEAHKALQFQFNFIRERARTIDALVNSNRECRQASKNDVMIFGPTRMHD
jgi:hypothetical protein